MISLTHNRYLIYSLIGHEVSFDGSRKHGRFMGIVNKVRRNIFENVVELVVAGRCHSFQEPDAIVEDNDRIVFLYGSLEDMDLSDSALFLDMRQAAFTECVDDVITRTTPGDITSVSFHKGPKKTRKKRGYRKSKVLA